VRALATATPQRTCPAGTPLQATAGGATTTATTTTATADCGSGSGGSRNGSGGGGGGGGGGGRGGEGQLSPRTNFVAFARVRFPVAATPLWAVRFVVRTLAPVIVAKVAACSAHSPLENGFSLSVAKVPSRKRPGRLCESPFYFC